MPADRGAARRAAKGSAEGAATASDRPAAPHAGGERSDRPGPRAAMAAGRGFGRGRRSRRRARSRPRPLPRLRAGWRRPRRPSRRGRPAPPGRGARPPRCRRSALRRRSRPVAASGTPDIRSFSYPAESIGGPAEMHPITSRMRSRPVAARPANGPSSRSVRGRVATRPSSSPPRRPGGPGPSCRVVVTRSRGYVDGDATASSSGPRSPGRERPARRGRPVRRTKPKQEGFLRASTRDRALGGAAAAQRRGRTGFRDGRREPLNL